MAYKEEYLIKNININNMNKTKKDHILEYKKKFMRFKFDCRIDSVIEKFNKNKKVIYILCFIQRRKM